MKTASHQRAVRWLRAELPALVAGGTISEETARALERHDAERAAPSRNIGFVILATVGSALIGAGIILLIAHNWDERSRAARSVLAFLPLLAGQLLCLFVLLRPQRIETVARKRGHFKCRRHRHRHFTR